MHAKLSDRDKVGGKADQPNKVFLAASLGALRTSLEPQLRTYLGSYLKLQSNFNFNRCVETELRFLTTSH